MSKLLCTYCTVQTADYHSNEEIIQYKLTRTICSTVQYLRVSVIQSKCTLQYIELIRLVRYTTYEYIRVHTRTYSNTTHSVHVSLYTGTLEKCNWTLEIPFCLQ